MKSEVRSQKSEVRSKHLTFSKFFVLLTLLLALVPLGVLAAPGWAEIVTGNIGTKGTTYSYDPDKRELTVTGGEFTRQEWQLICDCNGLKKDDGGRYIIESVIFKADAGGKKAKLVNDAKEPLGAKGMFEGYGSNIGITNLRKVDMRGLDTSQVRDMSFMFSSCNYLESLDMSGLDTSNVTDMNHMFAQCFELTSLDMSGWDTSKVTNMNQMFASCKKLTSLDLSGFDTSKVTDMHSMFADCSSLTSLDMSGWDTLKVTDMSGMFADCSSLTAVDLSSFNTSNVGVGSDPNSPGSSMASMFSGCSSLTVLDLSSFDTSNVKSMEQMFSDCSNLKTIYVSPKGWKMENVNGYEMFSGAGNLRGGKGTGYSGEGYNDASYACIDEEGKPGCLTYVPVTEVLLSPAEKELSVLPNGTLTFTATVEPSNTALPAAQGVRWTSSKPDVAKVNGRGVVTAIKPGTAIITATSNADGKAASCTVKMIYGVTVTAGKGMTAGSGAESQAGLTGPMTPVVYTADDGYYFPEDYSVAPVNGISVTRNSFRQITVSGASTTDVRITLPDATAKSTPTVTAPGANNRTYDGTEKPLINAGTTDHGTLMYSLDGGVYSTDIPVGTDAGTYIVYYRVSGDAKYNSTAPAALDVTIAPLGVTVTITGNNNTSTYDGTEHSVSGYRVETGSELYKEKDFTFSGKASATQTNVGTAHIGLSAGQFKNTNANFDVSFKVTDGYQTVSPAKVTVTADDKSKTSGAADPVLTATVSGLVNGDSASVIKYTLNRTQGEAVGEYAITPTGAAEQGNYTVAFKPGTLTITEATKPDDPSDALTPEQEKAVEAAKDDLKKDSEEKAKEAEKAAGDVDTSSESGQALADLLNGNVEGSEPEEKQATQAAALEVKEELEKSGLDVSDLTADEVKAAVENKKQEREDAAYEKAINRVPDTKAPAATDLLKDSSNEALKQANEELSVQPKLVEPEVLDATSRDQAATNIEKAASGEQKVDEGVDLDAVKAAAQPGALLSSKDITIEPASDDLKAQAEAVEKVFNLLSADLAGANEGKGLVISVVLPEMTPHRDGFYPLRVNHRHLIHGQQLRFWPSVSYFQQHAAGTASVADATSGKLGQYFFLDQNNVPTTTVSGDAAQMTAVAFLTAGSYPDAFITADATEKDQAALKTLEEKATGATTPTSNKDGGGCDAGLGFAGLLALLGLALRKKR